MGLDPAIPNRTEIGKDPFTRNFDVVGMAGSSNPAMTYGAARANEPRVNLSATWYMAWRFAQCWIDPPRAAP
jgi:hypothetical protein